MVVHLYIPLMLNLMPTTLEHDKFATGTIPGRGEDEEDAAERLPARSIEQEKQRGRGR